MIRLRPHSSKENDARLVAPVPEHCFIQNYRSTPRAWQWDWFLLVPPWRCSLAPGQHLSWSPPTDTAVSNQLAVCPAQTAANEFWVANKVLITCSILRFYLVMPYFARTILFENKPKDEILNEFWSSANWYFVYTINQQFKLWRGTKTQIPVLKSRCLGMIWIPVVLSWMY
jgi:hypothetical protein